MNKYVVSAWGEDKLLFTVDVYANDKDMAEEYACYKSDCLVPNLAEKVKRYDANLEVIY